MNEPTRPLSGSSAVARPTDSSASPVDRAKAEVERTKEALVRAKDQVSAAVDDKRGGEATSVDDATSKAEKLRREIERDVATLRSRVPDPQDMTDRAKTIGAAVGGGALALGTAVTLLRKRSARKAHEANVREQAIAIARELARIDLDEIAEEVEDGSKGGRAKWVLLLIAAAGAGAVAWQRAQLEPTADDVFGPLGTDDVPGPQGVGPVAPTGPPAAPDPTGPPPPPTRT